MTLPEPLLFDVRPLSRRVLHRLREREFVEEVSALIGLLELLEDQVFGRRDQGVEHDARGSRHYLSLNG